MTNEKQEHSWPRIFGVFAAGVAVAFLVGKVPVALPALRQDIGLTLFEAGLLVSLLAVTAALAGVFVGALSESVGQRRTALIGFAIAIAAGVGGAVSETPAVLLAMRALEGVGFFLVSVSLPALIIQLADDKRRQSAMGLWGAYLPLGAGLVVLAGGAIIALFGWRGLWLAISAAMAVAFLLLVWASGPIARQQAAGRVWAGLGQRIRETVRSPGAVMLALTFGCYSGQYLAVTSFVPLILVENAGWQLPSAAAAGAVVMFANAFGSVAAGLLLQRGFARGVLVIAAAFVMALGAIIVMSDTVPVALRIAGAVLFASFGGLIPGALFAGIRQHAPSAEHASTANGLMLQASSIGQFSGPAVSAYIVSLAGGDWIWALLYLLPMAALTALAGIVLTRIERG